MALNIAWFDSSRDDISAKMAQLRKQLSPRGDVVSEAGKKKTMEIFGEALTPQQVVAKICRDVDEKGLEAVLDYSKRIDGADLKPEDLRVPVEELERAHREADPALVEAVRNIKKNIVAFQSALLPEDVRVEINHGYLCQKYRPMKRIGICCPGGAAAYPSTILMTAIPAQVAGVEEIAVVAPPTPNGAYNINMLATCCEIGVREVYRVGGAQAVAAMAYGVEGLPKVDKIVGPGNLFVALAKKLVYGDVDIDSIAGPSEVVVIVDHTTDTRFTALDLIAQAEHSPGASILIGHEREVLEKACATLDEELNRLERGALARTALETYGAVILAKDEDEVCALTDQIAPEHLHIATDTAAKLEEKIRNAGAVFLGNFTPVASGDYAAGPSHVLPTSGTARFAHGLCANDFLRSHSVIHLEREGLKAISEEIRVLATKEGLTAHRQSVVERVE